MPRQLPFLPPVAPMLATAASARPTGDGWLFEPKWDGSRALVWNSGDDIYLQSRDEKPLERYVPELAASLRAAALPARCVLDGENVIATGDHLDFDALLQRIHPAARRVGQLAAATPASFVAWDLLAEGDEDLRALPQATRRARLEAALAHVAPPIHLTPATRDRAIAQRWFDTFEGAGQGGVMATPVDLLKIKHPRTAECVVAGFRWYKGGTGTLVGSLLLGLHDDAGVLHHVGVASSFKQAERARLVLAPYGEGAHGAPVARLGRIRRSGVRAVAAGRDQPVEPRQGPVVGAAADRAGGGGVG